MIRNDSISPLTLQSRIEHAWNLHKMVYTQLIRNFLGHIWPNFWKCMTDELGIEWYRLGTRTNTKMRVNLINFRLQYEWNTFKSHVNPAWIPYVSRMDCVCMRHIFRIYTWTYQWNNLANISLMSREHLRIYHAWIKYVSLRKCAYCVYTSYYLCVIHLHKFLNGSKPILRMLQMYRVCPVCNTHETLTNCVHHEWNAHAARETTFLCMNHAKSIRRG